MAAGLLLLIGTLGTGMGLMMAGAHPSQEKTQVEPTPPPVAREANRREMFQLKGTWTSMQKIENRRIGGVPQPPKPFKLIWSIDRDTITTTNEDGFAQHDLPFHSRSESDTEDHRPQLAQWRPHDPRNLQARRGYLDDLRGLQTAAHGVHERTGPVSDGFPTGEPDAGRSRPRVPKRAGLLLGHRAEGQRLELDGQRWRSCDQQGRIRDGAMIVTVAYYTKLNGEEPERRISSCGFR